MTTIVADRTLGVMAADRQSTSNDCDVACVYQKIRVIELRDGIHLLASSGNEAPATLFEDWYEHGEIDEPLPTMEHLGDDDTFTTVILNPRRELWITDKFMRPYLWHGRRYATGTGGAFAWAILEAGCDVHVAMQTAIRMDPHSGFGYEIATLVDNGRGWARDEYATPPNNGW